ncbi:MAG: phosphoribosylformylglycinamidine synthase, partial [Bacteroidota bacterium]
MIHFFGAPKSKIFAVQTRSVLSGETLAKLNWLFGGAEHLGTTTINASFIGPRAAMITPWSTNAVEITQNMGIHDIIRIEEFIASSPEHTDYDPMLFQKYTALHQELFTISSTPEPVKAITHIATYNLQEGLALSEEEIHYLEALAQKLGRALTDSEVFGFSQVNSEHCRHKIFNGTF